jgi:hypothetical protein
MRALLTAIKTTNVAAIVMYENVGYLFPKGEGPGVPTTGFGPLDVPVDDFKKLTKIPMQVVWATTSTSRPATPTASSIRDCSST